MEPPKPYRETRPWGGFIEFTRNIPSTVKILEVNPHEALSLQTHQDRDEFWFILSGEGEMTIGKQNIPAIVGEKHWIPKDTEHRIKGGENMLRVLEISFGKFSDEDIVRLEDKYGRS